MFTHLTLPKIVFSFRFSVFSFNYSAPVGSFEEEARRAKRYKKGKELKTEN
jgi:hypothetical protein